MDRQECLSRLGGKVCMKSVVVVGAQWGDEGKGKVVDYLAGSFDYIARVAGGHNAGHTVIIGKDRYVLQLIPRSEEHTSELQSRLHLVCRLLLDTRKRY